MPFPTKRLFITLIPAVLASLATVTSFAANFLCTTVKFVPSEEGNDNNDLDDLHFGVWYQQESIVKRITGPSGQVRIVHSTQCVNYPGGMDEDGAWKATRAFSIITPVIGGLAAFTLWFTPFVYWMSPSSWKNLAFVYLLFLPLGQGLTFLILPSNLCKDNSIVSRINSLYANGATTTAASYPEDCEWDAGSTTNIFSTLFWCLTGVAMLLIGAPVRPEPGPPELQTVTYERTQNPTTGTTAVAEVMVVKGTAVTK